MKDYNHEDYLALEKRVAECEAYNHRLVHAISSVRPGESVRVLSPAPDFTELLELVREIHEELLGESQP